MPSEFQMILMSIQGDLNNLTLCSVAANQAVSGMLGLYSDEEAFSEARNKHYVSKWSVALGGMGDSIDSFISNVKRLEEYLNGK